MASALETRLTVTVHLDDPAALSLRSHSYCEAGGPFVALELGGSTALLVHDVAVLEALSVRVAEARVALLRMQTDQDPLPSGLKVERVAPPVWVVVA